MTKDGVYFKEVEIINIKCFKKTHRISFAKPTGELQQWNVILGNNNTGKTTILKILSSLIPQLVNNVHFTITNDFVTNLSSNNQLKASVRFIYKNEEIHWSFSKRGANYKKPIISDDLFGRDLYQVIKHIFSFGYGISRKMAHSNIRQYPMFEEYIDNLYGIFQDDIRYTNVEEWLLQLDLASAKGDRDSHSLLGKVKEILTSELLPDVKDIELISETKDNTVQNYALFHTDYGKVRLRELGYGYQSTMVWVVDLAKKMFERFHKLENPLHGSAICLVDEIDLHLHPDWQRKIIKYLSDVFPNVQFIVTAHSPLIIQSAEDVNLIILEKDEENIHIRQEFGSFQGWTVEEILQDLMGLGEKTLSDTYLNFLRQFEIGIDEEDYEKAKSAFDELNKILHPTSSQRKLLKLQLSSIAPLPASIFA